MTSGIVFNIQPYSLHDGSGIRTIVFLKGCPLRCIWCCNPESQNAVPEVYFDSEKCIRSKGCKFCDGLCNITEYPAKLPKGDCATFENVCPTGALGVYGKRMTVDEVLDRVESESAFYSHGGGGLTLSGGEPFMQGEFALELLTEAKKRRIGTAAETCGYCETEVLRKAAGMLDEIMFDIKLADEEKHIRCTGASNRLILKNLEMLSREFPTLKKRIRTPVIPTVNDNEKDIYDIKRLVSGIGGCTHELIPYHRFGVRKYELLGRQYADIPERLDENNFERLKKLHL